MIRRGLLLVLALIALPATAEVFTYIDAQGNRVYTDQPRANAKRVPIATSNRMAVPASTAAPITTAKNPPNQRPSVTTCCAF